MIVLAIGFASLIGISLGLLGGGGSIMTLPILKYVLGQEAHVAVAGSLFVVGVTSLFALIPHARAGRVRWKTGLFFGGASMLGAYLAGRVAKLIPPEVLLVLFAVMMVVTAVAMLRGRKDKTPDPNHPDRGASPLVIMLEGLVVGAVTGLVGAGGGFLVVPALVLLGGLPMNVAVGTSLMVLAMKSFAGFAGHASAVVIDWPLLAAVTVSALAGSFLGAWAAGRVSQEKLRRGFGWFVIVMGVFMLAQEVPPLVGDAWPIGIPVALAAAAAGLAVIVDRALRRRALGAS